MQVALHNNVKVYNLTAGKSLPEWLAAKKNKNKSAKGGQGFTAADERRVELIHDFEFPDFARTIFRTPNGSYLFAAGDYPPRLKCFDVNEMSLKFSFNADMPIMSGVCLSPDFRKFALRGEGRTITVHNCGNIIDRLRVPHTQRCLEYHDNAAELLSGGNGHEIFRISLDEGKFIESYKTASEDGVNSLAFFKAHGLIIAACENGTLEAFDPRQQRPAGILTVEGVGGVDAGSSVRALCTDAGGLVVAAGSSTGQVALFDIRTSRPLLVKDHMTSLPIVKVAFYQGRANEETHVLSADTQALRVWHKSNGKNFTTIDAPAEIFDFAVIKAQSNLAAPHQCADSGVIALCCDTPKIQVHFVPALGPAPRWAGFLDSITEEMEETDATVVYDDFKFITKAEADSLGLSAAEVADGRVRPAMHGMYVENRLYRDLKAVADPQGFNRMLEENRRKKRDATMSDRISKFHRHEPAAVAAAGAGGEATLPQRSGMTALTGATARRGAVADAASAMMTSLTPQAVELLKRDPRFGEKLGLQGFGFDANHPDFGSMFAKVKEQQERAARLRATRDRHQFRVVADAELDDEQRWDEAAGSSDAKDEARAALRTSASAKRRAENNKNADYPTTDHKKGGDGVQMLEASQADTAFGATARQSHEARKAQRQKSLTIGARLAKAGKARK